MIDLMLLAVTLVLAKFIAKLDINRGAYILLRTSIFMIVLLGICTVLNGWLGAESIIKMSKSLKDLGIGYPYSWETKTIVLKARL